jgi:hypothetical protein
MDLRKQLLLALSFAAFFVLAAPAQAATKSLYAGSSHLLAYTDPGSGAMLWQLLLSSGVLLSFYYSRARKWVGSIRKPKNEPENEQ